MPERVPLAGHAIRHMQGDLHLKLVPERHAVRIFKKGKDKLYKDGKVAGRQEQVLLLRRLRGRLSQGCADAGGDGPPRGRRQVHRLRHLR